MHLTSSAARAVSLKLCAKHPHALVPAAVVRLPGLDARYAAAVRLLPGAALPPDVEGVVVQEPEEALKPVPEPAVEVPAVEPKQLRRPRRANQRELAIALLSRPGGVSCREFAEALDILPHTARATLSVMRRTMNIQRTEDRKRYLLAG